MATIHKEITINKSKEFIWDAIRDVGSIHKRLVRGFVVDCKLEGDWRIVTFANGTVVRELIVSVDDATCRHSWAAVGEPFTHYNASLQVFLENQNQCRVVWTADLMPNEITASIEPMIQEGLKAMKQTLERSPDQNCKHSKVSHRMTKEPFSPIPIVTERKASEY